MLMRVREFDEKDEKLNKLGYPTWYFLEPTFFLFVQTKLPFEDSKYFLPDSKYETITSIVMQRTGDMEDRLGKKYNIKQEGDPAWKDLVEPAAADKVNKLKVDVFKVVQDMAVLFLSSPKTDALYLNKVLQKIDPSFVPTKPYSNVEASQLIFNKNDTAGIILHSTTDREITDIDEVMLTQKSVASIRFLATIDVQQYLAYARQFRNNQ